MYNFDIGDEFHCYFRAPSIIEKQIIIAKITTPSNFKYQIKRLEIERHSSNPDYYTVIKDTILKSFSFGDTIRDTLPFCNIYHPYIDTSCGYIFCTKLDTLWSDTNRYNRLSYSFFTQSNCFEPDQTEKIYVKGLGIIYDWEYQSSTPTYEFAKILSYYKKSISGESKGSQIDFSVGINELLKLNFNVYPNPATNFITVNYIGNSISYNYQLMNSLGQVLLSGKNEQANINVSSIPTGIYFLKLTNKEGDSGVKRVVVSR